MHSLEEPLDLKLSISKLRAAREKRGPSGPRARAPQRPDTPPAGDGRGGSRGGRRAVPASPSPGLLRHSRLVEPRDGRFPAAVPVVDLSLSPRSGGESPAGSASLSPERQGSGDLPGPLTPHVSTAVPPPEVSPAVGTVPGRCSRPRQRARCCRCTHSPGSMSCPAPAAPDPRGIPGAAPERSLWGVPGGLCGVLGSLGEVADLGVFWGADQRGHLRGGISSWVPEGLERIP